MPKKPNTPAPAAAKPSADHQVNLPMPDLPRSFVFYDTETSGLSKAFDQILQFAAARTDGDLNIDDEAENSVALRARRLPWVVPSPSAMQVTRLTPTDLEVQTLSSYELLAEVTRRFEAWSPAIFIGHNTIRFDEEILRHGLFAALRDPYITQLNDNVRADTLIMLHAVHLLAPGSINVPLVHSATAILDGSPNSILKAVSLRPSFKLGNIARANGITLNEADAHDALADVKATIEVARLIRDKALDIFKMMLANASKAHVLNQLQKPWLEFDAAGKIGTDCIGAEVELALSDSTEIAELPEHPAPFEPLLLGHVYGASGKLTPVLFTGTLADNKNAAIALGLKALKQPPCCPTPRFGQKRFTAQSVIQLIPLGSKLGLYLMPAPVNRISAFLQILANRVARQLQ